MTPHLLLGHAGALPHDPEVIQEVASRALVLRAA